MEKLFFDNKARKTIKNCPCMKSNKDGKFVPYKGFTDCGFCHSCGETFLPQSEKAYADTWRKSEAYKTALPTAQVQTVEPSFIEPSLLARTMQRYDENNFTRFLEATFENDETIIEDLINRFSIGTAKNGFTIFWQLDINGNIRSGQKIFYNPTTGKRNKDININWVHTLLGLTDFNLKQCFFGEYQLATENKTVAIVEAAKTAAIMTPLEPRCTWIASGGANGLTLEKCKVLRGRKIILCPDLNKFDAWTQRAKELKNDLKLDITVSDLLENYVSRLETKQAEQQIKDGLDLADYAIKFNWYVQTKQQQAKFLPISTDEQILQSMYNRQPLIKDLINRLNLVNAKTLKPFQTV